MRLYILIDSDGIVCRVWLLLHAAASLRARLSPHPARVAAVACTPLAHSVDCGCRDRHTVASHEGAAGPGQAVRGRRDGYI